MGAKRIQPGARSKQAKHRQQQRAAAIGRQLKAMGVKVGRRPRAVEDIPNLVNYRGIARGMGRRLVIEKPRRR